MFQNLVNSIHFPSLMNSSCVRLNDCVPRSVGLPRIINIIIWIPPSYEYYGRFFLTQALSVVLIRMLLSKNFWMVLIPNSNNKFQNIVLDIVRKRTAYCCVRSVIVKYRTFMTSPFLLVYGLWFISHLIWLKVNRHKAPFI